MFRPGRLEDYAEEHGRLVVWVRECRFGIIVSPGRFSFRQNFFRLSFHDHLDRVVFAKADNEPGEFRGELSLFGFCSEAYQIDANFIVVDFRLNAVVVPFRYGPIGAGSGRGAEIRLPAEIVRLALWM